MGIPRAADVPSHYPSENREMKELVPKRTSRLMFVQEVVDEVFNGNRSAWWVRKNVAPSRKIRLGHSTCAWYEHDVLDWVDSRMEAAA